MIRYETWPAIRVNNEDQTHATPRNKINENIIFSEKSLTGFSLEYYPA